MQLPPKPDYGYRIPESGLSRITRTELGFPLNVLGIKTGNREKNPEKRGNSRNFVEQCDHALLVQLKDGSTLFSGSMLPLEFLLHQENVQKKLEKSEQNVNFYSRYARARESPATSCRINSRAAGVNGFFYKYVYMQILVRSCPWCSKDQAG
jgi:hypothetical protein